jgi:general secretion pathway protein I
MRDLSKRGGGRPLDSGSVLVEAMVAITVIAMMLAVTYRAVGESVVRSRAAEASRAAVMIAQSRLALVGAEIPLAPGETTGVDGDFAWRIQIDPAPEDDASTMGPLLLVTASVRDRGGKSDHAIMRTERLGPVG